MEAADGQKARQLSLRSGVGLEAHGGVPGDLNQPLLKLVDQLEVSGGLIERGEGMDLPKLWPGDGLHLARGVELHGARAERNHGAVEREVTVGQPP